MKKKVITLLLSISCTAMLAAGCGSSASGNVKLAQSDYKGIEVEEVLAAEVTDEDVEDAIQSSLEENATTKEVKDRAVKDGDTANIDYTGKVDGEEFDGGSAEGYDLEVGSGSFIDGFEEQIIGHEIGEKFYINVTFPEDYMSEDVAGKDAVFTVKINSISVQKLPELNDKFVKSVSEESTNVDEYKEEIRNQLTADNEEEAESTFEANVIQAVVDKAEVSGYDEDELSELKEQNKAYYEQIISSFYGMTVEDYLEESGQTEEDFEKEIEESCKEILKQQMVCEYIAEQEKLTISDEEYQQKLEEMVSEYGYADVDALIADYASYYDSDDGSESSDEDAEDSESAEVSDDAKKKAEEELKKNFLQEKVTSWLIENCKKTEASADTNDTEDAEDAESGEEE